MEGANEPPSSRGVIPNSFEHIFDHIALHEGDARYLVRASYFEIYNEEIRDLLSDAPARGLELKEADSGVYVKDLKSVVVKSVSEIDKVLQQGKANRSVGATLMVGRPLSCSLRLIAPTEPSFIRFVPLRTPDLRARIPFSASSWSAAPATATPSTSGWGS